MEQFYSQDILVGIKIGTFSDGTNPVTDPNQPLQVLALKHPAGKRIEIHTHTPHQRITHVLQKCLMVKKGEIRVELYGPDKKYMRDVALQEGDFFILINGAWGVSFLQDSEIIEIKNGPFKDDRIPLNTTL